MHRQGSRHGWMHTSTSGSGWRDRFRRRLRMHQTLQHQSRDRLTHQHETHSGIRSKSFVLTLPPVSLSSTSAVRKMPTYGSSLGINEKTNKESPPPPPKKKKKGVGAGGRDLCKTKKTPHPFSNLSGARRSKKSSLFGDVLLYSPQCYRFTPRPHFYRRENICGVRLYTLYHAIFIACFFFSIFFR